MRGIQKTRYCSYKIGVLPKGCQLCVKGSKLVLFVTGLCNASCYFCPISDKKYNKDVVYADEWPIKNEKEIIKEAELINAEGAGITGGDPLARLDRTINYIKLLKKKFGKMFHIHLYAPLNLVNEKALEKLYKSGLDEIRLHPNLDSNKLWSRIELAQKYNWKTGVEIPAIPKKEKQAKKLIDFLQKIRIGFLNLNELEMADNRQSKLSELGYKTKNELSYAVKGSQELALKLLKYCKGRIKNVHYCTAALKDKVQLANRIKRRAKNIAEPFDMVNKDGTLTRGCIYLKELMPSAGYAKRLEAINKKPVKIRQMLKRLKIIRSQLKRDFKIKNDLIIVDRQKLRIVASVKVINKIKEEINRLILDNCLKDKNMLKSRKGLYLAIVTEYPTFDSIILELEYL